MAMIDPKEGKAFERDPEEGNFPSGMYLCELSRVQEIGPSAKFPSGNPRLVFEFTVADPACPQYAGKKCATFVGRTLLKSKEGRESNLVKMARMMGVANPEKGFDPDHLVGKKYQVMSEHTDGRSWARSVMLVAGPPAQQQTPTQPADGPFAEACALITAAATLDVLKTTWAEILDATWGRLGDTHRADLTKRKDERKAVLSAPPPVATTTTTYDRIPF